MSYDSPHWQWGPGICTKHRGQSLPCKACIEASDPDLITEPTAQTQPEASEGQLIAQAMYDQVHKPDPSLIDTQFEEKPDRDLAMSNTFAQLYSKASEAATARSEPVYTDRAKSVSFGGGSMLYDQFKLPEYGITSEKALDACLRRSWILSVIEVIEFHIPPDHRDRVRPKPTSEGKSWQQGPWDKAETWDGMLKLLRAEVGRVDGAVSAVFSTEPKITRQSASYRDKLGPNPCASPEMQEIADNSIDHATRLKKTSDMQLKYGQLMQWKSGESWDLYVNLPTPAKKIVDDMIRCSINTRQSVLIRAATLHVRHVEYNLDWMPINSWERGPVLELQRRLRDDGTSD